MKFQSEAATSSEAAATEKITNTYLGDNCTPARGLYLDAALGYAASGWRVLPLEPRGKRPHSRLAPRGRDDASNDPAVVRDWWTREPRANVALLIPSNAVVVSVDPSSVPSEAGYPATCITIIDALERALGWLPDTLTGFSGPHGMRWWLRDPWPTLPLASTVDGVAGVSISRAPGYVVAPPSVDGETGWAYRWARFPRPMETLPVRIRQALTPRVRGTELNEQVFDTAVGEVPACL